LFRYQAQRCEPYRRYTELLGIDPAAVSKVEDIPFLPIELFKSSDVYCGEGTPEIVFTSSNTGATKPSRHLMASLETYRQAFTRAFEHFYGKAEEWSIYGLLPNYLEREGSSLVYMVDTLIKRCGSGGFYLNDYEKLIEDIERDPKPKILLGVSYALWDVAEKYAPKLQNTIMHGASDDLPRPLLFFGSGFNKRLQKWKYSAMLKLKSELNAAFPASLLSPFLLSPPLYHIGFEP
jgi:hypothetical protein